MSEEEANETGDYDLFLKSLTQGCAPLLLDTVASDRIDPSILPSVTEIDCYNFVAASGNAIRFRLVVTDGTMDPKVEVFNPDNAPLTGCSASTNDPFLEFDCVIENSGTHTVVVSEEEGNETGDYELLIF